jgi:phosphoribosyl-ATP pyrophosphohydrolase/phosphoribosyl-AMP cyclohydrolase
MDNLDFNKNDGLIPAIIQDNSTNKVLMLGYMNEEALKLTLDTKKVTFYSRSKNRLWVKGETSGNYLILNEMLNDCDNDTLLIKAKPMGPVCHTGSDTCFKEKNITDNFLLQLEDTINSRINGKIDNSYTYSIYKRGLNKVAQKVGEEAVELIIEAKDDNRDLFLGEAADLVYHFLILLVAKDLSLNDVVEKLYLKSKY